MNAGWSPDSLSFLLLFDSRMIYLIYTTDIPPCFFFFHLFFYYFMYHEQAHITAMRFFFLSSVVLHFTWRFELNTEIDSKMGRGQNCIIMWMKSEATIRPFG